MVYPAYEYVHKKINSPRIASLLMCLLILIILIIPSIFLVKSLVNQSYTAFNLIKNNLSGELFVNCQNSLCLHLQSLLQEPLINAQIQNVAGSISSGVIEKGSQLLLAIPHFIINLFVMFFTLYYFLKDGEMFIAKIQTYLSLQKKEYAQILNRLKDVVHGVVFGYLLIALLQGALGALGFFLFGINSPLFWGLVMALLALIPVLGTGIIWVPASLYLLFSGIFSDSNALILQGIGLFLYGLIIVSGLDNILRPKLISSKAKVHSVIVMVGIFGGLLLLGPLGVFIGPLILSFTAILVDIYLSEKKIIKK